VHSAEILSGISVFSDTAEIALGHHERLDGKGYPRGLKGSQINTQTRVVTVADVFDALTADRPYRKALAASQALTIMERDRGTAFDADCLDALIAALASAERSAA
jgi:HD-GYP domain-containing protein (c-di-GMP phosphodiesterase class II)